MNFKKGKQSLTRLIVIASVILFLVSATNKNKATLKINIIDCRNNYAGYIEKIKLIKNNENIREVEPRFDRDKTIIEIDTGVYFLEYKSIFNKIERIKIVASECKKYSVDLCINYIDHSKEVYKPIIDQLQNNESYKIIMTSHGCFHSNSDTLTISKKDNSYQITYKKAIPEEFKNINPGLLKTQTVNNKDLEAIRHFETELNYMTDGGCTTTDRYTINYKSESKFIDGNCSWNGGHYLKQQLFKEK